MVRFRGCGLTVAGPAPMRMARPDGCIARLAVFNSTTCQWHLESDVDFDTTTSVYQIADIQQLQFYTFISERLGCRYMVQAR